MSLDAQAKSWHRPSSGGFFWGESGERAVWGSARGELEILPDSTRLNSALLNTTRSEAIGRMNRPTGPGERHLAWQNTAYNQPPHPSFFIGNGMPTAPRPTVYTP
jgi:hypothetical protein